MKHLVEKYLSRTTVYQGKAVNFRVDTVRLPDGRTATREYLDHPGAVAVIPFISKDTILLVRQYRHPVGEVTLEVPAGKLDKGEKPRACAKRELEEETGHRAKKIVALNTFWPTPAFANEVIHIFAATELLPTATNPDEDEFIDAVSMKYATALAMIRRGTIRDAKTVIALLLWNALHSK